MKLSKPKLRLSRPSVPKTKKAMLKLLVAAFLLSCMLGGVKFYYESRENSISDGDLRVKLHHYKNTSCKQVIKEIGEVSAKGRNPEIQKKLLEKQMTCRADLLQFDQAILAAEELKDIYIKEKDTNNLRVIEAQIKTLKESKEFREKDAKLIKNEPVQ